MIAKLAIQHKILAHFFGLQATVAMIGNKTNSRSHYDA